MAGSKRWFGYLADDARVYAVELDESTYEQAALGFEFPIDRSSPNYVGPIAASQTRPFRMRYVNCVGVDANGRTVRRRIYVGSRLAPAFAQAETTTIVLGTTVDNTTTPTNFSITSVIGQENKIPADIDTGLIDGDIDNNFATPAP